MLAHGSYRSCGGDSKLQDGAMGTVLSPGTHGRLDGIVVPLVLLFEGTSSIGRETRETVALGDESIASEACGQPFFRYDSTACRGSTVYALLHVHG